MRVRLEEADTFFSLEFNLPEPDLDLSSILRDKEQVKCTLCNKIYSSKRSLARHRLTHHSEPITAQQEENEGKEVEKSWCNLCQRYIRKSFIRFHLNRCHVDETSAQKLKEIFKLLQSASRKCYKCNACDKIYNNYSSLKAHRYLHAGKFRCSVCNKTLSSRNALWKHFKIHKIFDTENLEGNENYVFCQKCKKYVNKRRLNFHNLTLHGGINLRPICAFCGKSFQTKAVSY